MMRLTGAELLVKALQEEGVTTLFAYPGGQAIDLFDALYDVQGLEVVIPRHEQGLVHAADGYARSTGKVGVCLVTSGPGATNLVTGIATAHYDSVPLVCFTGQVPLPLLGKETFQEVDIVSITQSITKFAVIIRRREELGPMIQKAFQIARDGRPGAVVVDIPKDIQQALGSDDYPIEQPDILIDFRRVKNLKIFFANTAIGLTTEVASIEEWQGGDIVVFENHIGIVSDRRNRNGVPYVIHHNGPMQTAYEQDILESRSDIVGHYRMSE